MSFPVTSANGRQLPAVLWTFALVGLAGAVRLLWWYWPGRVFDGVTSDVWTALAWNFADGEFYRPPLGPGGYGGTRYMPLLFVAHGLLIRAHIDPIHAGVFLMQASVAAAAAVLLLALRAVRVPARLAVPLAATVYATVIYQQYCTDLDPDYSAAALALAGAVCALRFEYRHKAGWLAAAAAAFVLAALTKATAIAFAAPVAGWLVARGRPRAAAAFAGGTAASLAAAAGLVQIASRGVFLESFNATFSGGMGISDVWYAVPKLFREILLDPFVGAPFALACWSAATSAQRGRPAFAHLYLATAGLVTLVIFASPGTVGNHLVDLHMASVFVIGLALAEHGLAPRTAVRVYACLTLALAVISIPVPGVPSVIATLRAHPPPSRAAVAAVHAEFLPPGTHYVSTDPAIAVLKGERPAVLDAFNLNRFVRARAPAGLDFERRIRDHDYQVIILRERRGAADDRDDLERLVYSNYDVRAVRRPFIILAPSSP